MWFGLGLRSSRIAGRGGPRDDAAVGTGDDDDTTPFSKPRLAAGDAPEIAVDEAEIDRWLMEALEEEAARVSLLEVHAAGFSDCGRRRSSNQDALLVDAKQQLFAVADGIGGRAGGDVASELACEVLRRALLRAGEGSGADELVQAVQMANRAVHRRGAEDPDDEGMGTTLTALKVAPALGRAYVAHVGDSRCYRLRGPELELLTRDHTHGAMLGSVGPLSQHLSRAIGIEPQVAIDLHVVEIHDGDTFLLCSDGLSTNADTAFVKSVLTAPEGLPARARALVAHANERGGKDNITVVLVSISSRTLD